NNLNTLTTSSNPQASLRNKRYLNCSSSTSKRQFSPIKTILPCCKWTDEKQGVGFEEWEGTL
ncbi:hypothetical protein, partial [Nostoc sp. CHAB 5715]|uniref:hypothetical protein n=1 Tax=Nostoc sp. CHAB 5715 TaxID=2780400 RepID=UPI001E425CCE